MKLSLRKLECAWHSLAFVLLSGAFVPLWRQMTTGGADPGEGDPVQRLFLGVAYLGVGLLIFHPRRSLFVARRGWLLWVLVGWAIASTLWSVAPAITLRRSLAAVLGVLYGLLLAVRYRPEEVLRMLGWAVAIVVLASLLAVVVLPGWAIMGPPHEGAWRGVLYHKNAMGISSVLALIVCWALYHSQRGSKAFWIFVGIVAAVILLGTRSATALAMAFALLATWFAIQARPREPYLLLASGSFAMAVALLVLPVVPDLLQFSLSLLGKDLTLTGRIPLWLILIPFALERPLLGYGYGAFWLGESGPSQWVWAVTWDATHAHNGFLDLWLELGLPGALLTALLVVLLLFRTARTAFTGRTTSLAYLAFFFTVFFLLVNTTESVALESGLTKAIYWLLFAYLVFVAQMGSKPYKVI